MKVKVYSTATCPWCDRAKQFLKEHHIKFEEINVIADPKAREDMKRKSGQMGVPVIEIGSKIIVGYDEDALKDALKI
jgi:glutaredoxin-like YruB-family protein